MSELITLDNAGVLLSNILNKLIKNKTLMRCLYYDSADALSTSLPDVTMLQIKDMSGKGNDPANQQRIFNYAFNNNIIDSIHTELRVFLGRFKPNNIYISSVDVCFQIMVYNTKINLDDNKLRDTVMVNEILKDINGCSDICGIGKLQLVNDITHMSWNNNFSGNQFYLTTRLV